MAIPQGALLQRIRRLDEEEQPGSLLELIRSEGEFIPTDTAGVPLDLTPAPADTTPPSTGGPGVVGSVARGLFSAGPGAIAPPEFNIGLGAGGLQSLLASSRALAQFPRVAEHAPPLIPGGEFARQIARLIRAKADMADLALEGFQKRTASIAAEEAPGPLGVAGQIAGRLGGDITQIALTGGALKAAGLAPRAAGIAASLPVVTGQAAADPHSSTAGFLADVGVEKLGPLDLQKISESPGKRAAFEAGLDVTLGTLLEALIAGRAASRARAGGVSERVLQEARAKPVSELAPGEVQLRRQAVQERPPRRPLQQLVQAEEGFAETARPLQRIREVEEAVRRGEPPPPPAPRRPLRKLVRTEQDVDLFGRARGEEGFAATAGPGPPEGERIVKAAVRIGDRVIEAPGRGTGTHSAAITLARRQGLLELGEHVEQGFTTNLRAFVNRFEAQEIAEQTGDVTTRLGMGLSSEQLRGGGPPGTVRLLEQYESRRQPIVPTEAKSETLVPLLQRMDPEHLDELEDLVATELGQVVPRYLGEDVVGQIAARELLLHRPILARRGLGAYAGTVTPNTISFFREVAPDDVLRRFAAADAIVKAQRAAVWLREVAEGAEGAAPGYAIRMTRQQYRQLAETIAGAADLGPLDGSTFTGAEAIFRNFTDTSEEAYRGLLERAIERIDGDFTAEIRHYRGEYLDGPAAFREALGQEGAAEAARILDTRTGPIYRAVGEAAGDAEVAGRIDRYIADLAGEAAEREPRGLRAVAERFMRQVGGEEGSAATAATAGPPRGERGFARLTDDAVKQAAKDAEPVRPRPVIPIGGVLTPISGAGLGAAAGAAVGGDERGERVAGAVVGGLAGAGLATVAGRAGARAYGRRALQEFEEVPPRTRKRKPPHRRPRGEVKKKGSEVQLHRFGISEQTQRKLEAAKQHLEQTDIPARKVTHREQLEVARELGIGDIERAVLNDQMDGTTLLAIRSTVNENQSKLDDAYARLKRIEDGQEQATAREVLQMQQGIESLEAEQNELLKLFIPKASEFGRNLNSLKIMAQRTLNPDSYVQWRIRAERMAGRSLLPEEREALRQILQSRATKGFAAARGDLMKFMRDLNPPLRFADDPGTWINMVRRAGLLTGLRTQSRNFLSNASESVMRQADAPITAGVDALMSRFTGQRTTAAVNPIRRLQASGRGARRAFGRNGTMARTMRGEMTSGELRKLDLRKEVNLKNRWVDAYVKFMYRFQGAVDQPWRQAAFMESLYEQARALGRQQGLKGRALEEFADKRIIKSLQTEGTELPDDMVIQAIIDSEEAVFQNPTTLGRGISGFKHAARARGAQPGVVGQSARFVGNVVDFVVPFSNTPSAVLSRLIERTPLGLLSGAGGLISLARQAGDLSPQVLRQMQRNATRRFGRGATGSLALAIGVFLASKGKASGRWPDDQSEARLWVQSGKMEDAVLLKLPGEKTAKWRMLTGVSPVGNLVAIGAQMFLDSRKPEYQVSDDIGFAENVKRLTDATTGLATTGALTTGRTVIQQSFLRGLNDLMRAVTGREHEREKASVTAAGSFVPIAVKDFANAVDPVIRDPQNLGQGIKAKIPYWSLQVPARLDAFGRPRLGAETGREKAARFVDPFLSREPTGRDDPLLAEMNRVGYAPSQPSKREGESDAAHRLRIRRYGDESIKALEALMADRRYQELDDAAKREAMSRVVSSVRTQLSRRGRAPSTWRAVVSRSITAVLQDMRQEGGG